MTERKTIKTQYSKLDECLEKLGIKENIRYGEHIPTEWHEIKVEENNNMIERYGNEDYMASQLKARSSNIRLYFGDEIDSPFMR